jgi:hypothetical protein
MDAFDLFAFLAFLVIAAVWRLLAGPVAQRHRRWWATPLAVAFVALVGAVLWEVLGWRPLEAMAHALSALGIDGLWRWLIAFEPVAALRDAIAGSRLGAWLVRAGQIVNQSLNLSFLIGYVGVRVVVDLLVTRRVAEDASRPPPKWFFAVADDGSVGLRGHWWFTRTLFRTLAVVAFALALLQVAGITARLPLGFGTGWPSLALLVLAELAWFFAPRPLELLPRDERTPASGEVPAPTTAGFEVLLRDLRNRWSPWLLADAAVSRPAVETAPDREGPCAMLGSDDDRHVEGCCLMFEALLAGRSVLVEDVLPHRMAPCIGFYLSDRGRRGERLLLLVDREDHLAAGMAWLAEVLDGEGFTITGWRDAFTANPTAVVATLQQNLLRLLEHQVDGGRRFGDDLGVIVALDAQATVLWHGPEVGVLTHAIADMRGKPPQVLAIGEWRDGADEAYRNIVGLDVTELQLADTIEGGHFLAWRLESPRERADASFFQEIVVGDIEAYLSPEIALAYPAVTRAEADVVLVHQEALPFTAFLEDAENTRRVGQLDQAYAANAIDRKLTVVANDWELRSSARDATVIIGRDRVFDVVAAARKWLPVTAETLVQMVSPPYLLRDYFCAHFDRRLAERRGFGALAPSYAPSPWSRAYTLYRRLERGWLDVSVARAVIEDAGNGGSVRGQVPDADPDDTVDLRDRLRRLLREQLALPVPPRFEFERVHRFVPSAHDFGRFEERLRVRLLPASREDRPRWHRVVEVVANELDGNGVPRVLASYFAGHLHQNLLVHQQHAFGGRLHRIDSISRDGARVHALAIQTPEFISHYRQHRTVEVKVDLEAAVVRDHRRNTAGTDALMLQITRFEVPLVVRTHGYYQFEAREGLDLAQADFVPVDVPEREYPHGKLLRARLISATGGERRDGLATTLALLLSEMLPSYFPEAHQYLRVVPSPLATASQRSASRTGASSVGDPEATAAIHLDRLVPPLEGVDAGDAGEGVTVYFIEDSPFDLGALATLVKKLDNILEDLKDYIIWYLGGGGETSRFLTFGLGEVPAELKLEELASFLTPFRAVGPVRRDRPAGGVEPQTGTLVDDGEKSCDFCGRVFDTPLTELEDGRHRCEACEADGVNTLHALRRHYREARRYFERRYGRRLRERIRIEFATAKQIAEYRGMSFSPHSGFDVRAVGLASRPDGRNTIHIENGAPKANVRWTVIHELTHIWQFENLPPALLMDRDFIEGQAVWVHLEYMAHLRDPGFESARAHFEECEDEYGRGYRRILAAMAAVDAPTALDVTGWPDGGGTAGEAGEESA